MLTRIEALPWDSEFFGLRIGRLRVSAEAARPARTPELALYDCVYVEMDVTLVRLLPAWIELGARPIDIRIDLKVDLRTFATTARAPIDVVTEWGPRDRATATALVRELSAESRFRLDPRFAPRVENLYGRWIERAFSGRDGALAWREDGKIVALLTFRREHADAWLELLAVDGAWRGRGIGTGLAREFLLWARADGATTGRVRTHLRNFPAIRTYESVGFRIEHCVFVLHWWSDDPSRPYDGSSPSRVIGET